MNCKINQVPNIRCDLGEGLIWDNRSGFLFMTDIAKKKLIKLDILSGANTHWQFNEPLAWLLLTKVQDKYLLGLKSGIALIDIQRPENLYWVSQDFPKESDCRLNDGCVDLTGRVWYGSMNMLNPSLADGQLASFSLKEGLQIHDDGFSVTNGPVISPDSKFLFFNDTLKGIVYRYRFDVDLGVVSDRQVFAKFRADQGYPDGMCFDIEGNLWIALWGGASVIQLSPNGQLLRRISIPALNVTNLCFCGPGLDRLIVSTASIGLSEEEVNRYPDSGKLFEICGHQSAGVAPYYANLESLWI